MILERLSESRGLTSGRPNSWFDTASSLAVYATPELDRLRVSPGLEGRSQYLPRSADHAVYHAGQVQLLKRLRTTDTTATYVSL
jgi:hypothetical protein